MSQLPLAINHCGRLVRMQGPPHDGALAMSDQLQAAVHGVGEPHRKPADQGQEAHDACRLLVVVPQPMPAFLVQRLLAQGLVVTVERLVMRHDSIHADPTLLREREGTQLQSIILGHVVRVDVRGRVERRSLQPRVWVLHDAGPG